MVNRGASVHAGHMRARQPWLDSLLEAADDAHERPEGGLHGGAELPGDGQARAEAHLVEGAQHSVAVLGQGLKLQQGQRRLYALLREEKKIYTGLIMPMSLSMILLHNTNVNLWCKNMTSDQGSPHVDGSGFATHQSGRLPTLLRPTHLYILPPLNKTMLILRMHDSPNCCVWQTRVALCDTTA